MNKTMLILFFIIFFLSSTMTRGNNVIEIRNDSNGKEYFICALQPTIIKPQQKYFLGKKDPDNWVGTTRKYRGNKVSDLLLWAIEIEYENGDRLSPGTTFQLLINKNIPSGNYIDYKFCSRKTKVCDVSNEFGKHKKDWDFIVAKKDEILTNAGLTDDSPDWDKSMAMVKYIKTLPTGVFGTCHPVETILKGNHCTGFANTMVALCSVMGIPGRVISTRKHTVCEVLIDGKWRFVENNTQTLANIPDGYEKGPLFSYSLLEMMADRKRFGFPPDAKYTPLGWTCISDSWGGCLFYNLEACSNWIFNLEGRKDYPDMIGIKVDHTPMSAYVLSALYPGEKTIEYKCEDGAKMWLTPLHGIWKTSMGLEKTVKQNNGLRQKFYISTLKGVKNVRACLLFEWHAKHNMPEDGGGWCYLVNGDKYYLKDNGGWNVKKDYMGVSFSYVVFDIPLDSLNSAEDNPVYQKENAE